MSTFGNVKRYVRNNWYNLLTTFLIFTNLFPYYLPNYLYYVGIGMIGYKYLQTRTNRHLSAGLSVCFLLVIWISSILNVVLDPRLILFTIVFLLVMPIKTSIEWHCYKINLMDNFMWGFVLSTFANFIAKELGINTAILDVDLTYYNWEGEEFSGFCSHPMWTSAAAAISTLYMGFRFFNDRSVSKIIHWGYFAMTLISIYVNIAAGSRSAVAFAFVALAMIVILSVDNKRKIAKFMIPFLLLMAFTYPIYLENRGAIEKKQAAQEQSGRTSRDEKWGERIDEFESSPIYGIGYAAYGVGLNKSTGRNETGGGWISILAQSGIIGFCIAVLLWCRAITPTSLLRRHKFMIVIFGSYVFFTLHSIFEGYMFQGGWYLCLMCWMTVGLLIEYKSYYKYWK